MKHLITIFFYISFVAAAEPETRQAVRLLEAVTASLAAVIGDLPPAPPAPPTHWAGRAVFGDSLMDAALSQTIEVPADSIVSIMVFPKVEIYTWLREAFLKQDEATCHRLITFGANINERGPDGQYYLFSEDAAHYHYSNQKKIAFFFNFLSRYHADRELIKRYQRSILDFNATVIVSHRNHSSAASPNTLRWIVQNTAFDDFTLDERATIARYALDLKKHSEDEEDRGYDEDHPNPNPRISTDEMIVLFEKIYAGCPDLISAENHILLKFTVWTDQLPIIEWLLDHGVPAKYPGVCPMNPMTYTLLLDLAEDRILEIWELLWAKGAKYTHKFNCGQDTIYALMESRKDAPQKIRLIKWLIKHGADIHGERAIYGQRILKEEDYLKEVDSVRRQIKEGTPADADVDTDELEEFLSHFIYSHKKTPASNYGGPLHDTDPTKYVIECRFCVDQESVLEIIKAKLSPEDFAEIQAFWAAESPLEEAVAARDAAASETSAPEAPAPELPTAANSAATSVTTALASTVASAPAPARCVIM